MRILTLKLINMTSKEIALIAVEKFQEEYPKRPLWQTMLEIEDLIDKHVEQQLSINGVMQHRELLIAYNLDFYKGVKDVRLEDIELNVDKYLSNL